MLGIYDINETVVCFVRLMDERWDFSLFRLDLELFLDLLFESMIIANLFSGFCRFHCRLEICLNLIWILLSRLSISCLYGKPLVYGNPWNHLPLPSIFLVRNWTLRPTISRISSSFKLFSATTHLFRFIYMGEYTIL